MIGKSTTVVVIDDSATIRTIVGRMLSARKIQALCAESVELALKDFGRLDVDAVITDIFMPGVGGLEGIRRVRAKWPKVAVVAMSGGFADTGKDRTLEAARRVGAEACLAKPFTEDELAGVLDEVLR